ncbi:MAG TPA: FAD-dependent oxidoreductase, partial [Acidimicrobiales bacterium]|nr:FAD-dependent oxidoreductase [Acidimicrobiales bacterium]
MSPAGSGVGGRGDGARRVVIVGGGLAGAKAAEELRTRGFDGEVTLIGEEPVRPYERPPLSKGFLQGASAADEAYVHPEGFYPDHAITLELSVAVTSLDVRGRRLTLSDGRAVPYDGLILATGASPRRLPLPGADLAGVHYLRTMGDAERLRRALSGAGRVVVIGAGWIGCEVAASARSLGTEVAMVDVAAHPLERVLGAELGRFYGRVHADHGVELHLGAGVQALTGIDAVSGVLLSDGTHLEAGAVVVGVGATPRVELAEAAGLAVENGVLADRYLAAGAPGVYV